MTDQGRLPASSPLAPSAGEDGQAGAEAVRPAAGPEVMEEKLAALQDLLQAKEAELRETAERLRMALASARMGTWEWNVLEGRAVWSEEQYRLLGHEPFSIEASLDAFRQRVHPDDIEHGDREFEAALCERRYFETEYRVIWPNGELHWVQARGSFVFDDDGALLRMFGVTLDFDRVKLAERVANDVHAKLRTVAEATPGTIFTYREAPDGRRSFPYATPHLRDTHGIEPEDLMRDASLLLARIHRDDADAVTASSSESRRTMTMWHCQFRHDHPHKGEVWLEAYSSPIRDADGGVTWHGIVHDITSVKHAEIELLNARERTEAADRAKSEFLANMSHEIRTPMSAIMGYADMLSAHLQDPDDLHSLETIRSNGRYLLEIIDDILDLSQIEAGKMNLDLKRARPDRLVLDVQSLLTVRAAEKGLALEVEFDGRLPQTIETDPTRLRQILINLIENAIKFTDKGEVKVVLRLVDGGSRLQIDVVDTGIGIPAATLPKLFRPFAQADSSATRRFRGSGLGLSICRALAKMLGGDVLVTTQVGAGSTFTLTIDVGDLTGVLLVEPTSIDPPPVDRRRHVRSLACSVLVVDDRRDMRHLSRDMLEEAGAQVALAVDGRDALSRVTDAAEHGHPFDLILLDMQMPVLDGYATAVELRSHGFDKPIIALTAHAMKEDEHKCLACGCDDYLSKPLEREHLVDTIAYYTQDVTAADLASRRATDASEAQGRPGYKVLIVDDNEDACGMMKKLLENAGCEVATATSGLAALAATGSFDTIVMDLGLPDISGAEVVARLNRRLELERCRFVCLSGRQMNEDDWRKLGFDHYIRKPARFEELERILGPRAGPRGIANGQSGFETASRGTRPR